MKTTNHTWLFKLSLLSISVLLMSAPIIAAALPSMFQDFPEQSKSAVETLLTVPNFGIILALLVSPLCIRLMGKKKTVMLGLTLALVSGLLPVFLSSYPLLFAARFAFGAGIGLFNSLAVSLLAEFFHGDELATMMGYQSMAGSLGSALLSFGNSYLVTLGWHQTFLAYLVILPVMILFGSFVKLDDTSSDNAHTEAPSERIAFNTPVLGLSLLIFFLFTFFMTSVVKLPEFIVSNGIGSASSVSIISGLSTLVGIPIGIFYGRIHKRLKKTVLPLGLFIASFGFFIISLATAMPLLISGVILIGVGFGLSVPFIYTWTAQVAPEHAVNISYTCLIIATNIGVFSSPLILKLFGDLFSDTSSGFSMLVAAGGFLTLSLVMAAKVLVSAKTEKLIKN